MAQNENAAVTPTPEVAGEQRDRGDWPRPGEEGYVHPDGTPQSQRQLEDNKRAAADRAAAGSTVHGAPLGTPGPTPDVERAKAVEAAENYDGKTVQESRAELTDWIDDKTAEKADEASDDEPAEKTARPRQSKNT
jgi:hypothetical protein